MTQYYEEVTQPLAGREHGVAGEFEPQSAYPRFDGQIAEFLQPATASYHVLGTVAGVALELLDLRRNPATQTTKTFGSLLIVARAVEHIRRTGEPILVFSPSSGNKAVALRDAVERALRSGLVERQQLRVATLTPRQTVGKMRSSRLSQDPELSRLNPMFILSSGDAEEVKRVGGDFVASYGQRLRGAGRLWATLRLENYRQADLVRAFGYRDLVEAGNQGARCLHAHSVSSAYGLLGFQSGLDRLRDRGTSVGQPGYFLVQHLATCDLVLHALNGSFDHANKPDYRYEGGCWVQDESRNFPARSWALEENFEETFYTHSPATAAEMSSLIGRHGGGGIVVSLLECLERYAECRALLSATDVSLPDDPRQLQEWSLVMALTGVLNGLERGVITNIDSVVIHATGSYSASDYQAADRDEFAMVSSPDHMLDRIEM